MGKASNIVERDGTYATGEFNRGSFVRVIEVRIDEMSRIEICLQERLKNIGLHRQRDGGTEFFDKKMIEHMTPLMKDIGLYFREISKEEIDHMTRKYRENEINQEKEYIISNNDRTLVPNKHQSDVLDSVIEFYERNDIGKVIWACGLGKALLCVFIADLMVKKLNYRSVIIGVPSKYLQGQMLLDILKIFPNEENVIFVGGNGINDVSKINSFIEDDKNTCKFIITTYHSCHLLKNVSVDLKIGDEAHHLVGKISNNQQIDDENKRSFLEFHTINSKKTLFMTATEKIIENYEKSSGIVYSMNDEICFGKEIDRKSVFWAVENRKITDYKVLTIENTEEQVDNIFQTLKLGTGNMNLNKEMFISAITTLKTMIQYNGLSHVLIYTNSTAEAELVNTYINIIINADILEIGRNDLYNCDLHSKSVDLNMKNEVEKFERSKYAIISCVYIFGEGFNLPKLNGVCIAGNMNSEIRIVQYILRPNRLEHGNNDKIAYYIVPKIKYDDFDKEEKSSSKIQHIIRELGNIDKSIEQKIICLTYKNELIINARNTHNDDEYYRFELIESHEELERLKIICRHRKSLISRLKPEQDEFNYHRLLNQENKIESKEEYTIGKYPEYVKNPEEYFKSKGVWSSWYDFLGVDTSKFLQNIQEWRAFCKNKKITVKNYNEFSQIHEELPKDPSEFYVDFRNLTAELGIHKNRR
jgi:predicted helicase